MIIHHQPFNRRCYSVHGPDYYCRDSNALIGHCSMSGFNHPCQDCLEYQVGEQPPRYSMPAMQLRTKYDWSDLKAGKIVGLMLGCFTRHWLVEYWPHDKY